MTASDTAFSSSSSQQETVNPAVAQDHVVISGSAKPDVAGKRRNGTVSSMDRVWRHPGTAQPV